MRTSRTFLLTAAVLISGMTISTVLSRKASPAGRGQRILASAPAISATPGDPAPAATDTGGNTSSGAVITVQSTSIGMKPFPGWDGPTVVTEPIPDPGYSNPPAVASASFDSDSGLRPWKPGKPLSPGPIPGADGKAHLQYYIVGGATHQWIAFQGYAALPPGELKDEMANYLPVDPNAPAYGNYLNGQSIDARWLDIIGPEYENDDHAIVPGDAVIQGTYEEDAEGVLDGTIDGVHFWNPDGGHAAGLVLSGTPYPSAFQEAQEETFLKALAAYPDRKAEAYYWLGRTAHLLADVSVPSHANLDAHSAFGTDDDQYEQIVAGAYKDITAASPGAQIPSTFPWTVPAGYPASYDAELSNLFYNLAKTARQFDSDNTNGASSEFGMGKFRSARNALTPGKVVSRVEYWDSEFGVPSSKRRDMVRGIDYDIQSVGEFRIYYYTSFYADINSTSRMVRVFYDDGSDDCFLDLDETTSDVFDEPLRFVYQPYLEARAIGYTAALYQLFWARTHSTPPPPATFRITSIRRTTTEPRSVELVFPSESAATYRVQHSPTLASPAGWTDAGVSATGTGAELTITAPDPGPGLEGRYFFRVVKM